MLLLQIKVKRSVRFRFKILMICSLILWVCVPVYSQTGTVDRALDEYESLLVEAVSLKRRSLAGESVLQYELYNLAGRLSSIRKTLGSSTEMTGSQKARMAALLKWYDMAEKGYPGTIVWVDPLYFNHDTRAASWFQQPETVLESLVCTRSKLYRWHPFAEIRLAGFDATIPGIRLGVTYQKWGGYLATQMTGGRKTADYTCLSDGRIPSGGAIYTSGERSVFHFGVSAGALYLPLRLGGLDTGRAGLYAGLGYGERNLYWQDIESRWARVSDRSWRGLGVEAGAILFYKALCASLGLHTVRFSHADFEVGIGVRL